MNLLLVSNCSCIPSSHNPEQHIITVFDYCKGRFRVGVGVGVDVNKP